MLAVQKHEPPNGSHTPPPERRHSRWYEMVLLGAPFQLLAGIVVVLGLPSVAVWGVGFWKHLDPVRVNTIWSVGISFVVIVLMLRRLARFTGGSIMANIAPIVTAVFLGAFAYLFFTRSGYSRPVLLGAYSLCLFWCYAAYLIGRRYRRLKLAVLPMEPPYKLESSPN